MKLLGVEIRNFRSFFADEAFKLEFAPGVNAIIGPNNSGKSNILRALALALDPDISFNRERDWPAGLEGGTTRIVCSFELGGSSSERTLRKHLKAYEQSTTGRQDTFADGGIVRSVTTFRRDGRRQDVFESKGAGALTGDPMKLDRALRQFRHVYRFILLESGDSLDRLLRGRVREVLRTVLQEHLKPRFERAESRRIKYLQDLKNDLLLPLSQQMTALLQGLFSEISSVSLEPEVTGIEQAISEVGVSVTDAVTTPLTEKGTGIRGAILIALLRYLAEQSRESIVFAVEEPEAFLHPAAQELLRGDLELLAQRADVTLILTTHSPLVVSRSTDAAVFAIEKHPSGATSIGGSARGDEPRASLLGGLFLDAALPDLLERAAALPHSAKGFLIVEGLTDRAYIEQAVALLGWDRVSGALSIIVAGGAMKAVIQALILKSQTDRPLLVLLDNDEVGRAAKDMLANRFGFQNRKDVMTYAEVIPNHPLGIEAEDLFPAQLLGRFVESYGEEVISGKQKLPSGEWHFDFSKEAKDGLLSDWLRQEAGTGDFVRWKELLTLILRRLDIELPEES